MELILIKSGAGATGARGLTGPAGSAGTAAPNITSATAVPSYGLLGNDSAFGFAGTITLPTAHADYAHLLEISVESKLATDTKWVVIARIARAQFGASTVAYSGGEFLQTGSATSWSVRFVALNDTGAASTSPITVSSITVRASAVTSVSGVDAGDVLDPPTRLVYAKINAVPVLNGGQVPQSVTAMLSKDNGSTWIHIGAERMTTVGQTFTIVAPRPATAQSWKVAYAAGFLQGNAAVAVASLPAGFVASATITVAALALPGAGDITTLTVAAGAGGSYPYDTTTPDGMRYFAIPSVSFDDSGCIGDVNARYTRVTAQDLDASHNPVGPEKPFFGAQPGLVGRTYTSDPLIGQYGTVGDGYTRTGNVAYVRLKVYEINRVDETPNSFANAAAARVQTGVGSGAGYMDVLVATAGVVPAGALNMARVSDASLGAGLFRDSANNQLVVGNGRNPSQMLANPAWDLGALGWTLDPGALVVTSGSALSGPNMLQMTGASTYALQTRLFGVSPQQQYYGQVQWRSDGAADGSIDVAIDYYDAAGVYIDSDFETATAASIAAVWTQQGLQATVRAGASQMQFRFHVVGNTTGAFYLDNALLRDQVPTGPGIEPDGFGGAKAYLATPLAFLGDQISVAAKGISQPYIDDQAVTARTMATSSVTFANAAIAGNAIVDSNVASMQLGKLIAGAVVFSGDIIMSRGSGLPVTVMNNTGMFLYSSGSASGSGVTPGVPGNPTYSASGLTSAPYVGIQSTQIGVFSGGTGPSVTITGSGVNLWSVNGNTGSPYFLLTSSAATLHNGSFALSLTAAQIQMTYSGGVSMTLNSSGLSLVNGSYSTSIGVSSISMAGGGSVFSLGSSGCTLASAGGFIAIGASGEFSAVGPGYTLIVNSTVGLSYTQTGASVSFLGGNVVVYNGPNAAIAMNNFGGAGGLYAYLSSGALGAIFHGGGVVISSQNVLGPRQTGPGNPFFTSLSDVQSWCQILYNGLKTTGHGLLT